MKYLNVKNDELAGNIARCGGVVRARMNTDSWERFAVAWLALPLCFVQVLGCSAETGYDDKRLSWFLQLTCVATSVVLG
jgi:hypothetical protein